MRLKKRLSLALALFMLLSVTACQPTANPPVSPSPSISAQPAKFTPGTYEGTGAGKNAPIVMRVTVDENEILSIEAVEHAESVGISEIAFERVPKAILDGQTLAVDAIATATISSDGILEAVKDALTQAGADIDALMVKPEGEAEKPGETIEKTADVVVIGGGGAGLSAAVSAKQNGASVILIEKMPKPGGNTIIAGGGLNAADPAFQKIQEMSAGTISQIEGLLGKEPYDDFEAGLQKTVRTQLDKHLAEGNTWLFDSPELHALQTYNGGDYKGNPEMITTLCNGAPEAVAWLTELGMEFRPSCTTVAGGLYQRSHASGNGLMGAGYIATLENFCKENGVELLMDTRATEIMMENGRAVGVRATSGADTVITHATKGVILATGGFGANIEMREKYNTMWPRMDATVPTTNAPSITGDGIVMAEDAGAALINMEDIQCLPFGDPQDGGLGGLIIRQPENAIFVNKEGKRFVSEYERRDTMTKALLEQTDSYMYIILDKASYENDDVKTSFSTTIGEEIAAGRTFRADTIEDLAGQIGLDPTVLKATVDEYNAGVDAQKDAFGKTPMKRIDTAPFYANPRVPTVHHTMGGVQITTSAQAVGTNGEIIPGLFAAGEVTGGVHGTNRLGGNAIADIIVFGRIAGASAAK